MVWQEDIEELADRRRRAAQMGGPEGITRQHQRGKMTVRDRITALADRGSFREIGGLAGAETYEDDKLTAFTPAGWVIGMCKLDGRKVVISCGDFTVRGGALSSGGGTSKSIYAQKLALQRRLPFVRLLDSAGGSVRSFETMGRTYIPDMEDSPGWFEASHLLGVAPVVSAVMGAVAGGPAIEACMAHFNLMVKGTTQVFVAGPPVVKAALGQEITKEELGNENIHACQSGVIDNVAGDEKEAFEMIRRFLGYMPSNIWEVPPRIEPTDDPGRRDEALLSAIPKRKSRPYDPYRILKAVLDRDTIFEIAPYYGRSRITALARVHGYPVGVMMDNPNYLGGSLDLAAGSKAARFIQLCDTFHLPMVSFVDQPGFMVGLESEKQGLVRAGARLACVTAESHMPWIAFVVRQAYGVAGMLHVRNNGMYMRYAWPSANWGSMHIEGGVAATYRRDIETAPDPQAKRDEIERKLKAITSPFRTAASFGIEDVIDPRDTRPLLVEFVEEAQAELKRQLGPRTVPAYRP